MSYFLLKAFVKKETNIFLFHPVTIKACFASSSKAKATQLISSVSALTANKLEQKPLQKMKLSGN